MAGQYRINFQLLSANGSAATYYIPAPFDLKVLGMQAACSVDPGDGETITISENSQEIGVLTFGTDIAAGATGTYAANATYGTKTVNAGDVIKVVFTDCTAAATFSGYIDVDPYCV